MTAQAPIATASQAAPKGWKVSTAGRSMDILSRQWISRKADERFLSLEDLANKARARAENAKEIVLKNNGFEVLSPEILDTDDRNTMLAKAQQITIGLPSGDEVAPTNWAFGQIAGLAKAPASYLRQLPAAIVSDALQYGLRYNRGAEDVKLYADDLEAMAITGPDYGRIFNHDVAEAVSMVAATGQGDHQWKVPGMLDWSTGIYDPRHPVTADTTTLFMNDRSIFIFLCQDLAPIEIGKLPNGEPDLVFRGFYVTNSEVGAGSLKLGAMYLRAICQNRILWGVEGFEELTMRHTKYAPARFVEEARPALESFANGSEGKLIEGITKAREAKIADTKEEALQWLGARNISRKRSLAIMERITVEMREGDEEDNRPVSAWEMAQGITAQAREEQNHDTRMDLELDAKRLLDKVA